MDNFTINCTKIGARLASPTWPIIPRACYELGLRNVENNKDSIDSISYFIKGAKSPLQLNSDQSKYQAFCITMLRNWVANFDNAFGEIRPYYAEALFISICHG